MSTGRVRCPKCQQSLRLQASVVGLEFYHPECLQCTGCKKVLDKQCYQLDRDFYCQTCHTAKFTVVCTDCQKMVTDSKVLQLLGRQYHSNCSPKCIRCKKPPADGQYFVISDKPHCLDCQWQVRLEERRKLLQANSLKSLTATPSTSSLSSSSSISSSSAISSSSSLSTSAAVSSSPSSASSASSTSPSAAGGKTKLVAAVSSSTKTPPKSAQSVSSTDPGKSSIWRFW